MNKTQLKAARPMASLENKEMKSNRENMVAFVRNAMAEARNTKPACQGGEGYGKTETERRQRPEGKGKKINEKQEEGRLSAHGSSLTPGHDFMLS